MYCGEHGTADYCPDCAVESIEVELENLKKTLELIWEHCKVIYYLDDLTYPLEHNPHAHKDMRNEIEKYLDEME